MSLALNVEGEYFLIDGSDPLLDATKLLAGAVGQTAKVSRQVIEDLDPKQFSSRAGEETVHIYLLGYVWNELVRNQTVRHKLLSIIAGHIERKESRLVFIAEPALEQLARPTMELRDIMCELRYKALYPCPHSDHCPMLDRPKDWCYSEGEWEQPPLAKWVDEELGMNRSRHTGTMFAFASPAIYLHSDATAVVVGRPVGEDGKEGYKGFFDYIDCSPVGIHKSPR
jgi:hypothetical protein